MNKSEGSPLGHLYSDLRVFCPNMVTNADDELCPGVSRGPGLTDGARLQTAEIILLLLLLFLRKGGKERRLTANNKKVE